MNYLKKDFDSVEVGITALKDAVSFRDAMCSAMYWHMLDDDCREIAEKLVAMGADESKLAEIGGRRKAAQ
ncbi:MAG: hypothetical protein AB7D36_09060 [Oscillospiraceae bacterium]